MSFDWKTEEEIDWDAFEKEPASPALRPERRRSWWLLGGLLLVVIVAAAGVAWRVSQQVTETTQRAEADVLASFNVVREAAVSGDREVVTTFLSGRDGAWAGAVETAVDAHTLIDRRPIGLTWLPQQSPLTPTVAISPDLTTATLTVTETYAIDVGNGISETVQLQFRPQYRLGPNRWLYSPPDPDAYWGEEITFHGNMLTVVYPQRDADVARRLALDLDAKLLELCARFTELRCLDELRVWMFFSRSMTDLAAISRTPPRAIFAEPNRLPVLLRPDEAIPGDTYYLSVTPHLPTPSLLGLPVDEAGYQALLRGYGRWLATAVITTLSDASETDTRSPFFQATLAEQMRQLSLQPWPLSPADYDALWQRPVLWDDLQSYWGLGAETQPDDTAAYALVDFVVNDRQLASVTQLQRALVEASTYSAWLQSFLPAEGETAVAHAWLQYVYDQSRAAQAPAPLPLPAQDLQLLMYIVMQRFS